MTEQPESATSTKPSGPAAIEHPQDPDSLALLSGPAKGLISLLSRRRDPAPIETRPATGWKVARARAAEDRHIELIVSPEATALVDASRTNAPVCVVDLADSMTPTWAKTVEAHTHVRLAVEGTLTCRTAFGNLVMPKNPSAFVLRTRPIDLAVEEVRVAGEPFSAGLLDTVLFIAHSASKLLAKGQPLTLEPSGVDCPLRAAEWCRYLVDLETVLRLPRNSIKISLPVESPAAALQLDDLIWIFRERLVAITHGGWRYIAEFLGMLFHDPRSVFPDRMRILGQGDFLAAYEARLVATGRRRGVPVIGRGGGRVPSSDGSTKNKAGIVRDDVNHVRESGFDGIRLDTLAAAQIAGPILDEEFKLQRQYARMGKAEDVEPDQLFRIPPRPISERGLRDNIRAGLLQLASWIEGSARVIINDRVESCASGAVSRIALRQWLALETGMLDDGRPVTAALLSHLFKEEREAIAEQSILAEIAPETIDLALEILEASILDDSTRDSALDRARTALA